MKNDKSQFVVRTSEFYLSLFICHLSLVISRKNPLEEKGGLRVLRGQRGLLNPRLPRLSAVESFGTRRYLVSDPLCRRSMDDARMHTKSQVPRRGRPAGSSFVCESRDRGTLPDRR